MAQIARIGEMEDILSEADEAVGMLSLALQRYRMIAGRMDALEAYYLSPLWRKDYEDDCAGRLPKELRRGVLSEDAVYNLLEERDAVLEECRALLARKAGTDDGVERAGG